MLGVRETCPAEISDGSHSAGVGVRGRTESMRREEERKGKVRGRREEERKEG